MNLEYCSILIHWLCCKIENTVKELICLSIKRVVAFLRYKKGIWYTYKAFTPWRYLTCTFILPLTGKVCFGEFAVWI